MEELVQPEKQLTPQAERILVRSLFMVSTEVANPLQSINMHSEILLKNQEELSLLNETQREYLTFIHQESRRALKTLWVLFDINCLLAGSLELDIEEINLSQLIDMAVAATPSKVQQQIPTNLPSIWADPVRLQQTLAWAVQEVRWAVFPEEERVELFTVTYDDRWVTFNISAIGSGSLRYTSDPNDPEFFFSRSIIEMHGGQMQVNVQEELKQLEISFTLPIQQNKPHPE